MTQPGTPQEHIQPIFDEISRAHHFRPDDYIELRLTEGEITVLLRLTN